MHWNARELRNEAVFHFIGGFFVCLGVFWGVSLLSRIRVLLWCFLGKSCWFNVKPNMYFAVFPVEESGEWVHIGPVLVSACKSAAVSQIVPCLGWFWQHYRRDLFGLLPPYQQLSSPPDICRRTSVAFVATLSCWHVQQISHKCFRSDSGTSGSTAIVNY